jgi:hypothetical protein
MTVPKGDQTQTTDDATDESTQDTTDSQDGGGDDGTSNDKPDQLGEAGKKAIAAERAKARAEATKRRELEKRLAAVEAAAAKAAKPDDAPTVDPKAIAEQAKAEARAELLKDRALDKIEVLAAKSFANPELARRLLDVDEFVADGRVDTDAIKDALAELLEANPGLAAVAPKRFNGPADQGPRNSKAPDLDQLIAAAAKSGDVREQIHLQNLRMLPQIQQMLGGPAPTQRT